MSQYLNAELGDKMMELTSQYLISIIDKGFYKINDNFNIFNLLKKILVF